MCIRDRPSRQRLRHLVFVCDKTGNSSNNISKHNPHQRNQNRILKLNTLYKPYKNPSAGYGLSLIHIYRVDYGKSRNLTLTSVVFVIGLSGIALNIGNVQLTGMVLASVVAMGLSLVFYLLDKLHLTNDQ